MNETVREWLGKAEGDYQTAARERQVIESSNPDAVCFHAQQCVKKLLKALLIQHGVLPPKTHDLPVLARLLQPLFPNWSCSVEELRLLTRAAVDFRYPGESADREEAEQSFAICERLRQQLLAMLESGQHPS